MLERDQLHVMVADVIKSLDTVDRFILDCALGRLNLPSWLRKISFAYHERVRLRFKFLRVEASLGAVMWVFLGAVLSMVFIVALYVHCVNV